MTATETAIKTHDELTIARAPLIPSSAIAFDLDESERRGRFIAVYRVTSSDGTRTYSAVYHARTAEWYCSCKAAAFGNVCKHLQSICYWNAYNAAFRAYVACDLDELRAYDLDFARMERGRLASYRGWEIDRDALADTLAERLNRTLGRAA
jgi:hypothetical protein